MHQARHEGFIFALLHYYMAESANIHFFFSSGRRHTRLVSDWSSDVCSSDLSATRLNLYTVSLVALDAETGRLKWHYQQVRSEERRVGKECRSRGQPQC